MKIILGMALSYFIGSFPTAYVVAKAVQGIDIRKYGSGNVGATNIFRVVGKRWGIGVLIFDVLKGFATSSLVPLYFFSEALTPFTTALIFGLAAIGGHTWTLWLRFRGGKGVATSAGVFLALAPKAVSAAFLIWMILFWWKRYVSLASLGMVSSLPLWIAGFYGRTDHFGVLFLISLSLVPFSFYTHRENLRRLWEGKEKKLI